MTRLAITASAALAAALLPQAAQAQVSVEGNAANVADVWGAELGLGYGLSAGGFTLRPGGGIFLYEGDNDRYYRDDLGNGQTRCRDTTNGQFADDSNCNNVAVQAYARLEATYTIPGSAELGIGARYAADRLRPYGTLSFPLAPAVRVKANVGDGYYAVGVRAGF